MNTKTLAQTCINSYREVLRRNEDGFGFSLGHDVGGIDKPCELARTLKARLIGFRAAAGVNFLALAILTLEAKAAHA